MEKSVDGFNWMKRGDFEKQTGISLRHLFVHCEDELVREGVARKWGKNWMIRPDRLDAFIDAGGTANIQKK